MTPMIPMASIDQRIADTKRGADDRFYVLEALTRHLASVETLASGMLPIPDVLHTELQERNLRLFSYNCELHDGYSACIAVMRGSYGDADYFVLSFQVNNPNRALAVRRLLELIRTT